jgi:hypothetical protein
VTREHARYLGGWIICLSIPVAIINFMIALCTMITTPHSPWTIVSGVLFVVSYTCYLVGLHLFYTNGGSL